MVENILPARLSLAHLLLKMNHCLIEIGFGPACTRGVGGTLIFSYIRRLRSFFWFKFWISIFLGVFRKMNFFWYKDFVDNFWVLGS